MINLGFGLDREQPVEEIEIDIEPEEDEEQEAEADEEEIQLGGAEPENLADPDAGVHDDL